MSDLFERAHRAQILSLSLRTNVHDRRRTPRLWEIKVSDRLARDATGIEIQIRRVLPADLITADARRAQREIVLREVLKIAQNTATITV